MLDEVMKNNILKLDKRWSCSGCLSSGYNVPFVTLPIFALLSHFLKLLQVFYVRMLPLYTNEGVKLSR